MPTQCVSGYCWCVYTNGVEIPDSRRPDTPTESMAHCRDAPPMDPVFPAPATIEADEDAVIARWLSKLLYSVVRPARLCRPPNATSSASSNGTAARGPRAPVSDPAHLEKVVAARLAMPLPLRNVTVNVSSGAGGRTVVRMQPGLAAKDERTDCPGGVSPEHYVVDSSSTGPLTSLDTVLNGLASCLVPFPRRTLPSESPSPSPSPSMSPSVSLSPSASPSPPVAMCGDVTCQEAGLPVHIHTSVPDGYCTTCLDGTSGQCRSSKTFACYPYVVGQRCHDGDVRCADDLPPCRGAGCASGHDAHWKGARAVPECLPYKEGEAKAEVAVTLAGLDEDGSADSKEWEVVWGRTVASALAVAVETNNLCDVEVLHVGPALSLAPAHAFKEGGVGASTVPGAKTIKVRFTGQIASQGVVAADQALENVNGAENRIKSPLLVKLADALQDGVVAKQLRRRGLAVESVGKLLIAKDGLVAAGQVDAL